MLKIYKISLSIMVGLILLYAFQGYYPDFITYFSNAFPPIIAGATVIVSGVSLERYWRKAKGRFPIVWLYFTCGLFLWFIGEAVWAGYTLILGVELPYPSAADIFWIAGYIPFFIALYLYVKLFGRVLTRKNVATVMAVTVTLTVVVAATLLAPILGAEEDLVAIAMDFAYPILDLSLLSVALLGLIIFWKGKLGKSWLLINAAIVMDVCADILFSYTTAQGTYYSGHMLDLLFDFSYLFFLMAFYIHTKEF
ncbi:MAG: hypothetical protein ACPL1Z_03770 [Candidatus Bathyarchaeales archaeon]